MIISRNIDSDQKEFESLLEKCVLHLNDEANKREESIIGLAGRNLEPFVFEILKKISIGGPFENTIELIGGQKFPDIVAKCYGIEVKTTTQRHWRTTGNSVLESTRVENIDRIYLLFARLVKPIEFRCRPYESVLSEVVVTHSPRYLIDMNLSKGETIFDKIKLPYDTLRLLDNPIRPIINYYKSKLEPGEDLWWLDQEGPAQGTNIVVRVWNNLSSVEKEQLRNKAMILFPEIFGNSITKFHKMAIWLSTREGIICPNIRDPFSAGGRRDIRIANKTYKKVPRIIHRLFTNLEQIVLLLANMPTAELNQYWGVQSTENNKIETWVELIGNYHSSPKDRKKLDLEKILRLKFNNT